MMRASGGPGKHSHVPTDRRYSRAGVWVRSEGPGGKLVRMGVTDHLLQQHGGLVGATVRSVGAQVAAGEELATLTTGRGGLGLPAPASGRIVAVNPALDLKPALVERDPYGEGWFVMIVATRLQVEAATLLDASAYLATLAR